MLPYHPLADLFPLLEGADLDALAADIRENGQRDPIIIHDGMILDGRNRYRACLAAGVEPITTEWDQHGSLQAFVVSKNLHRRHLNESQRAMIGAKLATLKLGNVAAQRAKTEGVGIPIPQISAREASELLNVHRDTIFDAKKVLAEGTPEEIKAVETGAISVHAVSKQLREKASPEKRLKKYAEPRSQVGKNPERIQRQQINAEIWGRLRDALTHLTSLPIASDVVSIARSNDKTGLVDARLSSSIKWLEDFANGWNSNRNEDAA